MAARVAADGSAPAGRRHHDRASCPGWAGDHRHIAIFGNLYGVRWHVGVNAFKALVKKHGINFLKWYDRP
jgi:hypothetical protein